MATRARQREVRFEMEDGMLVRTVSFPEGRPSYRHTCSLQVYEAVAYAVDEAPLQGEGLSLQPLARSLDMAYTQVGVALEFLGERGVTVTRGRRHHPASTGAYEDAMVEWHALREKGGETTNMA